MPIIKKVKGWLKLGYKTFNNSRSLPIIGKDDGEGKMVVLLDDKGDDFVMPITDFASASGGGADLQALQEKVTEIENRLNDDALERSKGSGQD